MKINLGLQNHYDFNYIGSKVHIFRVIQGLPLLSVQSNLLILYTKPLPIFDILRSYQSLEVRNLDRLLDFLTHNLIVQKITYFLEL